FGPDGNLYVANFGNGDVLRITMDGTVQPFVTIPGDNNGHLTYHDGLFYVAARDANQIYTVTMDGEVELFAGSGERGIVDGSLLEAQFSLPNDVVVDPTGRYLYVNDVVDASGFSDTSPMVLRRIELPTPAGTSSWPGLQATPFRVTSVGPNPSGSFATIAFELDRSMQVDLTVFDLQGRVVHEMADAKLSPGAHEVRWAGRDRSDRRVVPGVYFYRLETPAGSQSGPIHIVR
ncbi:MAG: T9SS type A sorting domain-containing protein, partial [Candidatus Eisenbacteria bacterium]|nr:T9SS type A sorting domain-containing protein [Candidatus Latescibacterota bacterium]MBD3302998.1 T9SS type A sorting domain-containing protein [Candidatus Eisenbacteria bacterium]